MTLSRSRLERVVAERLKASDRCQTTYGMPGSVIVSGTPTALSEVAVAAVLDEMSEGPLHDAMVEAGVRALNRLGGIEPDAEQDADIVLSAALPVARTYPEEGPRMLAVRWPATPGRADTPIYDEDEEE